MTDQPNPSHLTYFDGSVSVRAGVFRCRIHGRARSRQLFVAVHIAGSSVEDSFRSSGPLEVDLLAWADLDHALRLAGELAASARARQLHRSPRAHERRWTGEEAFLVGRDDR